MSGVDKINNTGNIQRDTFQNPCDKTSVANKSDLIFTNDTSGIHPLLQKQNQLRFSKPNNAPQNAYDFIDALIDNKDKIMNVLEIDSDTYDFLAQTAVGIADAETKFGTSIRDIIHKLIRAPYKVYDENLAGKQRFNYSMGMTNIKYTLHINDRAEPQIKDQMYKFGIYFENNLKDTEKSAIATVILLNMFNRRIDKEYLDGFEQSQENFGTTRMDALCALWKGNSKALKNGNYNPSNYDYNMKVRQTVEDYKIISD